jgi:hypothetical protein
MSIGATSITNSYRRANNRIKWDRVHCGWENTHHPELSKLRHFRLAYAPQGSFIEKLLNST